MPDSDAASLPAGNLPPLQIWINILPGLSFYPRRQTFLSSPPIPTRAGTLGGVALVAGLVSGRGTHYTPGGAAGRCFTRHAL